MKNTNNKVSKIDMLI